MTKPITILSCAIALALCTSASAQTDQEELELLRQQIAQLSERLAQLEKTSADSNATVARLESAGEHTQKEVEAVKMSVKESASEKSSDSWANRISWKGDLRYRHEFIDEEGKSDRTRQRIRARPALTARVNDSVKVGFGLATGGSDPVSTNQSLGGAGSSKDAKVDLAYFDWSPADGVKVSGGKFKNPFYKPGGSSLLWDGDWRPEGFMASYANDNWFGTALGTWTESDTSKDNEFAVGLQGGWKTKLGDGMKLTAGLGYYHFPLEGSAPLFDPSDSAGNTVDANGNYVFDYTEIEAFAELGFDAGGQPAKLFGHFVKNTDADDYDTGWVLGGKYGKAGNLGTWEVGYWYQDLEADAVLGLLTDSDFAGGGTDGKGHKFSAGYGLGKNWKVNLTYFLTERNGDAEDAGIGTERDYDRLQLDLGFKY